MHAMNALHPLHELREMGMVPHDEQVWLGLGWLPPKCNALRIDPGHLPSDAECNCVAGLDVILTFRGYVTRYGTLRKLCGSLYQARPRRLQIVDLDYRHVAFLKLGGAA